MKTGQSKIWLLISICWLILGFYFILSSFVYFADRSHTFNWESQFINRLPPFFVWAAFTPFIYRLITAYTSKHKGLFQQIKFLSATGITISIVHRIISVSVSYLILLAGYETTDNYFTVLTESKFVILSYMFDSFFTYGVLISVIYSINYYRLFADNRTRTIELERQLSQAELNALRMQLQPHFLFNTLNSISTLIHKDPENADVMLTRLSDLLRFTLDRSGKHKIQLSEELEFISSYLEIQKVRYGNRLEVKMKISDDSLDVEVPALVLQPVVENSVIHSLEKKNDTTTITISSRKTDKHLILTVKDNGPGPSNSFTEGIGLSNTRSRLDQMFGENASLTLENKSGAAITTITIPLNN